MTVKFFVGLTFYSDNSFAKTIQNFRSRFDEKYQSIPSLHLALVPPFEIEAGHIRNLKNELIEELESFYYENLSHHVLHFTGMDVHEYKKNKLLYLNPVIDDELVCCQESLQAICQSYITDREKKINEAKKSFLSIGRFQDSGELHLAIDLARKEFLEFTTLSFNSICLFSQKNGIWYREADLVTFEKPSDTFLHSSSVCL
jgi:2'-5' RNA ligase